MAIKLCPKLGHRSIFLICTYILIGVCLSGDALSASPFGGTAKNVATQTLQGAGPAEVDLNIYNLKSLTEIEKEWTANVVQKAAKKEYTLALGVKSDRELFVDTVRVTFPRLLNSGLGVELVELAGGREDELGITIVAGLVSGGSAEGSDILPGDSISEVAIVRTAGTASAAGISETREEFSAKTECLCYDATVTAILALPPRPTDDRIEEFYSVTLKRLRRKPRVTVKLRYPPSQGEPDATIQMFAGENLRQGMLVRGVKLNDPLALRFDTKNGGNCGAGGLCRTCGVSVLKGGDLINPQRLAEKQMLNDNPRWRLACKAIVGFGMKEGEITLRVNPKQWG